MVIGICDDEQIYVRQIMDICKEYCGKNHIACSCIRFSNGEEVLDYSKKTEKPNIDLLFLDIEMDGISGIELKEILLKEAKIQRIAFVTSHDENVFEAFSQKTIGFLKKPIAAIEIEKRIAEVSDDIMENKCFTFIGNNGKEFSVFLNQIIYFKGEGSYTTIYIGNEEGKSEELISKRLGKIENELKKYKFVRTHKSYLVNVSKITSLRGGVHVANTNTVIPIGRTYKDKVYNEYMAYGKWVISRK